MTRLSAMTNNGKSRKSKISQKGNWKEVLITPSPLKLFTTLQHYIFWFWEVHNFRRNLITCNFSSYWFTSIKDADAFSILTHSPSPSVTNASKMDLAIFPVLAQKTATWGQEGMSGDSAVMMSAFFLKPNLAKLITHIHHISLLTLNRSPKPAYQFGLWPHFRPSSKLTEILKYIF